MEELTNSIIYTVRNKYFPSNTYILKDSQSNECLLIDPGLDTNAIDEKLTELDILPIAILSTHGHFDHIGSVYFFQNKYNIPFYLHEQDLKVSKSANFFLKIAQIKIKIEIPIPDFVLTKKKEIIGIGNFDLSIFNFPGHSQGSCVIQYEKLLFTGDIIYKKGLGLNNFPGEDKVKLKNSLLELLSTFSEDSLVLPGHGESEYLINIKNRNQELIDFLN